MKQFMMLFWQEKKEQPQPSPEQMQAMLKQWQDWLGGIAAQDKLLGSEALQSNGKVIGEDRVITDGPYAEVKEIVSGFASVKAVDLDEATKMAEDCPMLNGSGWVEVREIQVYDI